MRSRRTITLLLFFVLCLSAVCFSAQARPATAQSGTDDTVQSDSHQDSTTTVSKLVYLKGNLLNTGYSIYISDPDGSNSIRLTKENERAAASSLSPDGTKIAYVAVTASGPELFLMDTNGGNKHAITKSQTFIGGPGWSPDSTQIIYYSQRSAKLGGNGFYIIDADGTNETHLQLDDPMIVFPNIAQDFAPAWSPDGSRILFLGQHGKKVDENGSIILFGMDPDGSNVSPILDTETQFITAVAWSPDSSQVVFANDSTLYVTDGSGTDPHQFAAMPEDGLVIQLAWSPDGTQIAAGEFTGKKTFGVYVVYVDSQDFQKIMDANVVGGLSWGLVPEDLVPTSEPTVQPTPTRTPIPTRTPRPTATPRPTITPRPTKTVKPSVTPKPSSTPAQSATPTA